MKPARMKLAAALAAVALALAGRAAAAPPIVWVVPFLGRVAEGDPPGPARAAEIFAARAEHEPIQVAIRAPPGGLTGVRVEVSELAGAAGRIPAAQVERFRERAVPVTRSTYCPYPQGHCPGPPGRYLDALVPFATEVGPNPAAAPFDVAPGATEVVWLDVLVPATAAPGRYAGTVSIVAAEGEAAVPVSLTVWAFTLPERPTLHSSFGLHGARNDRRHQAMLVAHRLAPWPVRPGDASWLAAHGLALTGLPLVSNQRRCALDPPPDPARLGALADRYPPDLSLYVYVADEPGAKCREPARWIPQVKAWGEAVHRTRARALVATPPTPGLLDDGTGRPAVDVWALLAKQWRPADPAFQAARARGCELWAYTALVQDADSPKWAIDYPPLDHRVLPGFLAASLGLDGILYWRVDEFGADPWGDPTFVCCGGRAYAGEGLLLYPGAPVGVDGPVASMRLAWIREGEEDYEYVVLLRAAGRGAWALEVSRSVAADFRSWSHDPAVLERARLELGRALDALGRGEPQLRQRPPPRAEEGVPARRAVGR